MFGRLTSILGGGGGPAFGYVPNPISEGDDAVLQRPSDNSMWTVTRGKAKVRTATKRALFENIFKVWWGDG